MINVRRIAISGKIVGISNWVNWASHVNSINGDAMMIRTETTLENLISIIDSLRVATTNIPILINESIEIVDKRISGFHHKSSVVKDLSFYKKNNFLIGKSCHAIDEVINAQKQGYDYVFLSPIFLPHSPKFYPIFPLGLKYLESVCKRVSIPVYALGGISYDNENLIFDVGAYGWASISAFSMK